MSILDRGPRGQFMWRGQALRTWLPLLLKECSGDELENLLEGGIRHCEAETGRWLRIAGQNVLDPYIQKVEDEEVKALKWPLNRVNWHEKRRSILVRALRELREVK